jgi:phosphoribosylamine--glycine ligase / phosphoribosylformylglycinamidine cyclo-ligase
MSVLVIGSCVREVAIIKKLIEDGCDNIICLATNYNPSILNLNENKSQKVVNLIYTPNISIEFLNHLLEEKTFTEVEFAIIGPEKYIELGFVDLLEKNRIPCLAPRALLARIETSKIYARSVLEKLNIDFLSPYSTKVMSSWVKKYETDFRNMLRGFNNKNMKIVLKRNSLCGGKGVYIQGVDFETIDEAVDIVKKYDDNYLIEERLYGDEFSLMTLTDGYGNHVNFPPVRDYKRLGSGDTGPNTGSMGCVIDKDNTLPYLTIDDIKECEKINNMVIRYLNSLDTDKIGYRGILYGSYMKCHDGTIKLIEFNSRFGDPEVVIALGLLKSNFYDICRFTIRGQLNKVTAEFSNDAMMCVYLVPQTYPFEKADNYDIYFSSKPDNKNVLFGDCDEINKHIYSHSSRSIICFEKSPTLTECFNNVYTRHVKNIIGNLKYRDDIGGEYLDSYSKAGVNIELANESLSQIKNLIQSTYDDRVTSKFGAFSGEFAFKNNMLLSSIDGVGTKSIFVKKWLETEHAFFNLGLDIVNHCINDILVQGGEPLFFLDYFGSGSLDPNELFNFVRGIVASCCSHGVVLMGGETAEMPDSYKENVTELIGCIIGVKSPSLINVNTFWDKAEEYTVLCYPSSGPHTNGYSLIRKLELDNKNSVDKQIIDQMVNPHRCYLSEINDLVREYGGDFIKGMCHITGGGLYENMRRVVPTNYKMEFDLDLIEGELPTWCVEIKKRMNISLDEMLGIFNCGIGYVVIVSSSDYKKYKNSLEKDLRNIGSLKLTNQ